MSTTASTPRTLWSQAFEHAKSGSEDQSQRLLITLQSIDRQQSVSVEEIAALRCLLALRRSDPTEAQDQARTAAQSLPIAQLLRSAVSEQNTLLPAGAGRLLQPILARSSPKAAVRKKVAAPVLGMIGGAVVVGIVAGGWWTWNAKTPSPPGIAAISAKNMPAATPAPVRAASSADKHMSEVVGKVLLIVRVVDEHGVKHRIPASCGTAFAVGTDGLMMTNKHVVEFGPSEKAELAKEDLTVVNTELLVAFGPDETEWEVANAQLVSAYRDIAILKVQRKFAQPLTFAPQYKQGDEVRAWGFPGTAEKIGKIMNEEGAVERTRTLIAKLSAGKKLDVADCIGPEAFDIITTRGIVSGVRSGDRGKFVQTDATVHHGNSGGPLVNANGEVIGVVSSGLFAGGDVSLGVNVAIPWETFQEDFALFPSIKFPKR